MHQLSNESRLSITDSLSEFFDAQEVLLSPSSSENEVGALCSVISFMNWLDKQSSKDLSTKMLDSTAPPTITLKVCL